MRVVVASVALAVYLVAVAWLPGVFALAVICLACAGVLFGLTRYLERRP